LDPDSFGLWIDPDPGSKKITHNKGISEEISRFEAQDVLSEGLVV
jgi:hypothetical protein